MNLCLKTWESYSKKLNKLLNIVDIENYDKSSNSEISDYEDLITQKFNIN